MKRFLLVAITEDEGLSPELVQRLFESGLDYLYWRSAAPTDALSSLPAAYVSRILVARETPIPFLRHSKEQERDAKSHSFSTSIHRLFDWPGLSADMVFFSPVFPSISKPGYGPTAPLAETAAEISRIRQEIPVLPLLIALGGVTPANVRMLVAAGFDGAAVMGTLWQAPDPVAALRALQNAVTQDSR
ncbi:MAG: thiamine phosphate synthase [Siphonobacter aquaeclarae]|nr:thiamine phosphate synthase [Siphonobacter aquaeclarae]